MVRRFDFDNLLSLVGAWFMFLLPFYWLIRTIIEWRYTCKHSIKCKYWDVLKESLYELTPSYWWSC